MDILLEFRDCYSYCKDSGNFYHKKSRGGQKKGDIAGTLGNKGYYRISLNKKRYVAHRLAWLDVYGRLPDKYIDHINGDRSDNRISNLRVVSRQENSRNQRVRSDNKSGVIGLSFSSLHNRWEAYISSNLGRKHIGLFDDFFEACCARKSAEIAHSYHPNHGRP